MTFGDALILLKVGEHVTRTGWNGKGMFLFVWDPLGRAFPESVPVTDDVLTVLKTMKEPSTLPYIVMKTADGNQVPWLASQTDLLAEDWTRLK